MATPPKLPPIPAPDVPVVGPDGRINPDWYAWLKIIETKVKAI